MFVSTTKTHTQQEFGAVHVDLGRVGQMVLSLFQYIF